MPTGIINVILAQFHDLPHDWEPVLHAFLGFLWPCECGNSRFKYLEPRISGLTSASLGGRHALSVLQTIRTAITYKLRRALKKNRDWNPRWAHFVVYRWHISMLHELAILKSPCSCRDWFSSRRRLEKASDGYEEGLRVGRDSYHY